MNGRPRLVAALVACIAFVLVACGNAPGDVGAAGPDDRSQSPAPTSEPQSALDAEAGQEQSSSSLTEVPDVAGLGAVEAEGELSAAGFVVAAVGTGDVVVSETSPPSGSLLPFGSEVQLIGDAPPLILSSDLLDDVARFQDASGVVLDEIRDLLGDRYVGGGIDHALPEGSPGERMVASTLVIYATDVPANLPEMSFGVPVRFEIVDVVSRRALRRASRSFGESAFAHAASAGLSVNDIEGRLDLELLESLEDRIDVAEVDGVFTLTLLSESGEVEASTIVAVPISVAFTGPIKFGEGEPFDIRGFPLN